MKNKTNTCLSVRKLFLTALVAGPLATLPAPLWALPAGQTGVGGLDAQVSNKSNAGITVTLTNANLVTVDTATAGVDRAIVTWNNFGGPAAATMQIAAGDTVNFVQPASTSAILNRVIDPLNGTTIGGTITSNGRVLILNPNGVTIANGATISTAGFTASTVVESDGPFAGTGDLSYTSSTPVTGDITVGAATLSTIGGGGTIKLVGDVVTVAGTVTGNLELVSKSAAGTINLSDGANPLTVNTTFAAGSTVGGSVSATTIGGNISLSDGPAGIVTVQGDLTANSTIGSVVQSGLTPSFSANLVGRTATINAGTGAITLGTIAGSTFDVRTLAATGGATTINDTAGDLAVTLTTSGVTAVTSANNLTVNSLSTSGSTTLTAANNLTLGASTLAAANTLSLVATAGNISTTGLVGGATTGGVSLSAAGAGKTINYTGTGALKLTTVTTNATGSVTLSATGAVSLPAIDVPTLSVTTNGDITQTGALGAVTQITTGTFDSGSGLITLNGANDFGTVVLKNTASGKAVQVSDINNITIGTGTNTAGATTVATTAANGNIIIGPAGSTLNFGGNLTLNANGSGTITNAGNGLTVGGILDMTSGTGVITLTGTGHTFGRINATTAGNVTLKEATDLNLGTINIGGNLSATTDNDSAGITDSGVLTVAGTTTLSAGTSAALGNITLDSATNALTGAITVTKANDFALTNTAATTTLSGTSVISGNTMFTTGANNIVVTLGAKLNTLSFTSTGGNITVNEADGFTLQNASYTVGAGTLAFTATAGNLTLGSGVSLTTLGAAVGLTAGGGTVADSVGSVFIWGPVNFAGKSVNISQPGNSFGAVGISATATDATIRENGNLVLDVVNVGTANKNLTATSDTGNISQLAGTGTISISGTGLASFTASKGAVLLTSPAASNNITAPVAITAKNASSIKNQTGSLTFDNIVVSADATAFTAQTVAAGATMTQSTGKTIWIYGDSSFTTNAGAITLTNAGNNFGKITAVSGGSDVKITEGGTMNLAAVTAGAGNFTGISAAGSIIDTGATGVSSSGTVDLTASATGAGITLDAANGEFAIVKVTTGGNAVIVDKDAAANNLQLAGGSNVGGTASFKSAGTISDNGQLTFTGQTTFESTAGNITIFDNQHSFGALILKVTGAGTVSVVENSDMNIMAGTSVGTGAVSLTTYGNFVTTGVSGSLTSFGGPVTITSNLAGGTIFITNPWFVGGQLTLVASGMKDISYLSKLTNLSNFAPIFSPTTASLINGPLP